MIITVDEIVSLLKQNADSVQADKMSAYMKNQFTFAGVPKPMLKEIIKPFLNKTAKAPLDFELVFGLWNVPYREAQYAALEYLQKHRKELLPSHISSLKRLICEKSWWETADTLDAFVGEIVQKDLSLKRTMLEWAKSDNLWLRRVAIDFQQEYGDKTDVDLLAEIIEQNLGSKEFFINKAIGWSLRDYSKVNPTWVSDFVKSHKEKMASLSIKEATKLL